MTHMPLTEGDIKYTMKRIERAIGPGHLLVAKEKHADRYFLIETEEQFWGTALKLITERKGWFYVPEEPEKPLSEEEISGLPKALQPEAERVARRYKQEVRYYKDALRQKELLDFVLDTGNRMPYYRGLAAVILLDQRSAYEYETFLFERLENVRE